MVNPLDLNNLPDDFTRDHGKETLVDLDDDDGDNGSSSSASGVYKKKKKDESEKVYECRFCSLKFAKSQALGGHMNRHRQERETEALNHARQLVFSNDNILPHQLGVQQPVVQGGFHHQPVCHMGTTTVYPTNSTTMSSHMYTSRLNNTYPDYFVCSSNNPPPFSLHNLNAPPPDTATNYTCIGEPVVGQSFTLGGGGM